MRSNAAKTRDDIINSDPQAIKRKHPWLSFKTVQNMSDAELQQAGFIMPPFHFHCRTTTVATSEPPAAGTQEFDAGQKYISLRAEYKSKLAELTINGRAVDRVTAQGYINTYRENATAARDSGDTLRAQSLEREADELERKLKELKEILKRAGVTTDTEYTLFKDPSIEYLPVRKLETPLSEDEIIKKIAGGDETRGSCASVALAYAAQKQGFDVLDFRDGESMNFFCWASKRKQMFDELRANTIEESSGKTSITNGKRILKNIEEGKEYYLSVARHAAIVKREGETFKYLELQSKVFNGWKEMFGPGAEDTLRRRFGCTKSSKDYAIAHLTDISQLKGDAFKRILGYINTSEDKQHKGASGGVK